MTDYQNYLKSNQYEWVFFDFFDTIVHRKENKDSLKMMWAKILLEKGIANGDIRNENLKACHLYEIRCRAEKLEWENLEEKKEPEYSEVCGKMYNFLSNSLTITEEEFCRLSLECDVQAELCVQFPDDDTIEMMKDAKANGKKIAIVSDFYLPKEAFQIFLSHHGIVGLVDEIYISSDYGVRKSDGSLYAAVKKILGIDTALMIGDNLQSDKINAQNNGLEAIQKKYEEVEIPVRDEKYIRQELKKKIKQCDAAGPYAGYILNVYLFIEKLYLECLKNGYKKVYFLSREGQRLKELFDLYIRDKSHIQTNYLCLSRYSLIKASQEEEQKKEFQKYLNACGITETEDIVVVDIGWKGTVQKYLSEIIENKIHGYYLGIREESECSFQSKKTGLLYDAFPQKSLTYHLYWFGSIFQEQLLVADHGTVLRYENATPVIDDDPENDVIYQHLLPKRQKENVIFEETIKLFQNTCYYLSDFEMMMAKNYLRMTLNTSRAYRSERNILNGMNTTFDNEALRLSGVKEEHYSMKQKIKRMLRRYRDVYRENKEPIEYLRIFALYSKQLKLNWLYPVLAKIVYRAELRFLRKRNGR